MKKLVFMFAAIVAVSFAADTTAVADSVATDSVK